MDRPKFHGFWDILGEWPERVASSDSRSCVCFCCAANGYRRHSVGKGSSGRSLFSPTLGLCHQGPGTSDLGRPPGSPARWRPLLLAIRSHGDRRRGLRSRRVQPAGGARASARRHQAQRCDGADGNIVELIALAFTARPTADATAPLASSQPTILPYSFPKMVRHERRRRDRCRRSDPFEACCIRDVGGPYGAALQGEAPNHRELRRSRAGVVSVAEKAREQRVRCEPRRRTRVNH